MGLKTRFIQQLKKYPIPFEWFRLAHGAKPAAELGVKERLLVPTTILPPDPNHKAIGPRRAPEIHQEKIAPALYLYEYSGYVTHQGGFITHDNYHIYELILYKDRSHPHDYSLRPFQKYKRFDVPVVAIVEESAYNYYHWHIHACTLSIELIRSGILQSIPKSYFIYAPFNHPYQSHTLCEIGFAPQYIINSRDHQTLCSPHIITINTPLYLTPAALEHWQKVKEDAREALKRSSSEGPQRIFISRAKARCRRILNEEALWEILRPYGFARICFEDLSYEDQRRAMIDATHVIFPHGAGGTNLLFAPPPCKVLEILQEGNIKITTRFFLVTLVILIAMTWLNRLLLI
jgi:hypothetical protein